MSHDENHKTQHVKAKLVRMANQIATFFKSKPHEEGVAGTADHIDEFWEPRMRRHLFEIIDAGGEGLSPFVLEALGEDQKAGRACDAGASCRGRSRR